MNFHGNRGLNHLFSNLMKIYGTNAKLKLSFFLHFFIIFSIIIRIYRSCHRYKLYNIRIHALITHICHSAIYDFTITNKYKVSFVAAIFVSDEDPHVYMQNDMKYRNMSRSQIQMKEKTTKKMNSKGNANKKITIPGHKTKWREKNWGEKITNS